MSTELSMPAKKNIRICVINTGGTISCTGEPLTPVPAEEFSTAARATLNPVLARAFPGTTLAFAPALKFVGSDSGMLDSTNLQPSDWCRIARYILEQYAEYDGFVVLHGTDTMAYTAAALPFLLNVFNADGFATAALSKPVVLTGSQVPLFTRETSGALALNFNTDAYQNLCGAVAAARLGMPEVSVYFNSALFRGARVIKVDAGQFRAFESPNYPALASCGIDFDLRPELLNPGPAAPDLSLDDPHARDLVRLQLDAVSDGISSHPVMPLSAFPAVYDMAAGTALMADLIYACVEQGVDGLILESYGEGNFPSGNPASPAEGAIYRALKNASDRGVVIINCTQVFAGKVEASTYAAGAWLPQAGALGAADMTATAALAKLTVLLSAAEYHGWSHETVQTLMQLSLTGEMAAISRLDSRRGGVLRPGQYLSAPDGSARLMNDLRRGPALMAADGTQLWSPFGQADAPSPGRLQVLVNGDLVFLDEASRILWHSNTATRGGAWALSLSGSYRDGSLRLWLKDYARATPAVELYPGAEPTGNP